MLTRFSSAFYAVLLLSLLFTSPGAHAGWRDLLKVFTGEDEETSDIAGQALGQLSDSDIIEALKQALGKGTRNAVSLLGREDGFLANPQVKIPLPKTLKKVEKGLRKIGKDELADEFVMTMNRAAEQAVPEAASIFADAVSNMSFEDARTILQGEDDAATQYFRNTSGDKLKQKFLPIVKNATDQAGVTSGYKKMTSKLGMLSSFIDTDSLDVDEYVTNQGPRWPVHRRRRRREKNPG